MIVIAGPNGSGKTSVTQKFLHHEWAEGTLYINPDEVAKDKYGDWKQLIIAPSYEKHVYRKEKALCLKP